MKEVEVLRDVRTSPDSPELIVIRQRLGVVDGEIQPIGEPTETRIPLILRHAEIDIRFTASNQLGAVLTARVRNAGSVPFPVTTVKLLCRGPLVLGDESSPPKGLGEAYWTVSFNPEDRNETSPLLPGEEREWHLPIDFHAAPLRALPTLPSDKYKLVVYSGKNPVGELSGEELQPIFASLLAPPPTKQPRVSVAVRNLLATMDPSTRQSIDSGLKSLADTPYERWGELDSLDQVGEGLYFLNVPPDYRILLKRQNSGAVEVIDVLRSPESQPAGASNG